MRPLLLSTRLLFTALILVVTYAEALQAPVETPTSASQAKHKALVIRVLEVTNAERAKRGAPPLRLHESLTQSADWLASDMARNNTFDHRDTKGRGISERAPSFGYRNWTRLGENIAAGRSTPEAVVQQWMNSAGHRKNLLDPSFRDVGIGYAFSEESDFEHYWVQALGTRP